METTLVPPKLPLTICSFMETSAALTLGWEEPTHLLMSERLHRWLYLAIREQMNSGSADLLGWMMPPNPLRLNAAVVIPVPGLPDACAVFVNEHRLTDPKYNRVVEFEIE